MLAPVHGSFSVGALAVKNAEGNAIGAVRLTVFSDRLEIDLLKVGSFAESFVPGALTESARFNIPYVAVRGLVRRGEALLLTLDPRSPTPHTRFALTHFTDLPLEALAAAHKRRARAIFLRRLLPLPAAVCAAVFTPEHLASGVLGRGAVSLAALGATFALAHLWVRVRSWGGPFSEKLREAFEIRVAERLAITPALDRLGYIPLPEVQVDVAPPPRPALARKPWRAPKPRPAERLRPTLVATESAAPEPSPMTRAERARPTLRILAAAATFAGMCVGGVAIYKAIDARAKLQQIDARAKTMESAAPSESAATSVDAPPSPPPAPPPCTCDRADSPLWATPMPALAVMLVPRQKTPDGKTAPTVMPFLTKKGSSRYAFDVVVVNDSAVPLKDVKIVLTFARRNARGERVNATDRGLFSARLMPGKTMKWGVSAPGTEYKLEVSEARVLGAQKGELAPAPPAAFVTLLGNKIASVRLHAAWMLAYLGAPQAREAADGASDLSESDEQVRQMILRATEPLRVCDVTVTGETLEACVSNTNGSPTGDLELFEPGPSNRAIPLGFGLGANSGGRVRLEHFGAKPDELAVRVAPVRRAETVEDPE